MFWITLLLLAVAYAPCSIGLSLPVKRKYRPVIALGLFFLAILLQVFLFAGLLPRSALLIAAWCSGVLIFSTPFFFLRDMVLLVIHIKKRRIPNLIYSVAGILLLAGILAAWGEYCAVTSPAIKPVEIAVPDLPEAFERIRVLRDAVPRDLAQLRVAVALFHGTPENIVGLLLAEVDERRVLRTFDMVEK